MYHIDVSFVSFIRFVSVCVVLFVSLFLRIAIIIVFFSGVYYSMFVYDAAVSFVARRCVWLMFPKCMIGFMCISPLIIIIVYPSSPFCYDSLLFVSYCFLLCFSFSYMSSCYDYAYYGYYHSYHCVFFVLVVVLFRMCSWLCYLYDP